MPVTGLAPTHPQLVSFYGSAFFYRFPQSFVVVHNIVIPDCYWYAPDAGGFDDF